MSDWEQSLCHGTADNKSLGALRLEAELLQAVESEGLAGCSLLSIRCNKDLDCPPTETCVAGRCAQLGEQRVLHR